MQQPLTFQGLHIRQPLLAFLGFPRLWFKQISLNGATGRIRTDTVQFLRLTSPTSWTTVALYEAGVGVEPT